MKKFKKIYIEITNVCNLKCSFCSIDNRKQEFMSVENFEIILSKIKDYTDYIYLHVKGEPLLHNKLDSILNIAKKYNIKVNITTNGTLLKEKHQILNNDCVKKINISLHCENNYNNYLENVFETVDKFLSTDKTIIYRIWTLDNFTLDEKSTIIVENLKRHYNLSTELVDKIKTEQNIKIKENIYVDKDNEFEWPNENTKMSIPGFCMALKTQLAILVDGTVVPCCLDSNGVVNLGNIFTSSLEEIINSERFINLKNSFQDRKPCERLCQNCTYKERFK